MRNLRDFILLVEEREGLHEEAPVIEPMQEDIPQMDVKAELEELIFKMRSYSEPLTEGVDGGYCLGFESGLEMAAGMLESLIREIKSND